MFLSPPSTSSSLLSLLQPPSSVFYFCNLFPAHTFSLIVPSRTEKPPTASKSPFLLVPLIRQAPLTTIFASPASLPPGGITICRFRNSPLHITKPVRAKYILPRFIETLPQHSAALLAPRSFLLFFFISRLCCLPSSIRISLSFFGFGNQSGSGMCTIYEIRPLASRSSANNLVVAITAEVPGRRSLLKILPLSRHQKQYV